METENQLIRYNFNNGKSDIEVNLANEMIWLSLNGMVELFDRDKSVISRHIGNIYKERELDKSSTVAKIATVQKEGEREIKRDIEYFNLDVIISVGYRVKSQRGTNFRIWATNVLKNYFIENAIKKSNTINNSDKYLELLKALDIASTTAEIHELSANEARGILKILQEYAYALKTLDKYDRNQLTISDNVNPTLTKLSYREAKMLIEEWHILQNTGDLFGKEKDESFKSSLNAIYQTIDGLDVYPGIEEKAANLLYFIVKNHSFIDGNKRIAAFLFVHFLDINNALYRIDGSKIIGDNALVAITIMIAESKPNEKETMVKLVVNLIGKEN